MDRRQGECLSDGSRLCLDCECLFVISEGERQHFAQMGYPLPKRCKSCRALRKALKQQAQ